jgi:predicted secreted protein
MSAIVLYAIIWFMTLFIVLPLRTRTQGEAGNHVPGTHIGAPEDAQMWKTARITTYWASAVFVVVAAVIISGVITMDMIERVTRPG